MLGIVLAAALATATPPNADATVRLFLQTELRDPDSAKIELTRAPRWGSFKRPFRRGATGWIACYTINAKNAYGGYTGVTTYLFVINSDRVTAWAVSPDLSEIDAHEYPDPLVDAECARPAD